MDAQEARPSRCQPAREAAGSMASARLRPVFGGIATVVPFVSEISKLKYVHNCFTINYARPKAPQGPIDFANVTKN